MNPTPSIDTVSIILIECIILCIMLCILFKFIIYLKILNLKLYNQLI